jgi:hypothetical protein
MSWSGVIKYHGVKPPRKKNQIFVANHTTVMDVVILQQHSTYAVVGQKHVGIMGNPFLFPFLPSFFPFLFPLPSISSLPSFFHFVILQQHSTYTVVGQTHVGIMDIPFLFLLLFPPSSPLSQKIFSAFYTFDFHSSHVEGLFFRPKFGQNPYVFCVVEALLGGKFPPFPLFSSPFFRFVEIAYKYCILHS